MSDFLSNIERRLNRRFSERVASTRSGRPDFYLSDWEVVDDHSAKVLIGYNRNFGVPRSSQVDQWVISTFNSELRLALESLRNHPRLDAVVGIVVRQPELAPPEYAERMAPIHASATGTERYVDDDNRIWEAMADDNGNKFLVRIARDDIAAILTERQRKIRQGTAHRRPRLEHLRQAGSMSYDVGDRVMYIDRGIRQFGEVVHVGEKVIHVKNNDEKVVVALGDVIDITEKSPAAEKESQARLIAFWTQIYGDPDFAKKLQTLKGTGLK